jgi:phage shock protein PspC (stress-responsive transcriptional regulator)
MEMLALANSVRIFLVVMVILNLVGMTIAAYIILRKK